MANRQTKKPAVSTPRTARPSAQDWKEAFYSVEDLICQLQRRAEVLAYLAGELWEQSKDEDTRRPMPGFATLAEITAQAATILTDQAKQAEEAYYGAFNDLVGRENEALFPVGAGGRP